MNLTVFNNEEFGSIRIAEINGEPWLVGRDVATILGYSNPQKAIRTHVDEEDKGVNEMVTPGGKQSVLIINESGLYSLILSSKMPKAKEFKHWVTSEVLPSIRKNGLYATEELLNNPDFLIATLTRLKEERDQRIALESKVETLQPKADYCDNVLDSQTLIPTTIIAKAYGWSAQKLNAKLQVLDVQYKNKQGVWILKQKYADKEYATTKTYLRTDSNGDNVTTEHTYWTQKGRKFIYDLLKENGFVPMIEKAEAIKEACHDEY